MSSLHALAMRAAHRSGTTALARRLLPGHGCLLAFHRVAAPGEWDALPNREFYLDTGFLGRLLDHLREGGWAIVSMDEAAARLRDGDRSRFVNLSIDDVYRDTVEAAVPVFRSRGVPVTLYVTTGIPDGTVLLWQAGLETIIRERDTVTLDGGASMDVGDAAKKRDAFRRLCSAWERQRPECRFRRFCAANGYAPDVLNERHAVTWAMLDALRDDPGVEIGGHTVSHPHLAALPDPAARDEMVGCRTRLGERLRRPVRHLAFPFGRRADCGPREFALARDAGFLSAATTRRGLVGPADREAMHALPRNILNGAHRDPALVETHLSGLGGVLDRLRGGA